MINNAEGSIYRIKKRASAGTLAQTLYSVHKINVGETSFLCTLIIAKITIFSNKESEKNEVTQ